MVFFNRQTILKPLSHSTHFEKLLRNQDMTNVLIILIIKFGVGSIQVAMVGNQLTLPIPLLYQV